MRQVTIKWGLKITSLLTICALWSTRGRAEDITWNGFFTTGIVFSDQAIPYTDNRIVNKPNITNETLIGLNLSKTLSRQVEMAAQFVGREEEGESTIKADWAFLTYSPADSIHFTVGKQKLPMWMVSSYIDVGAVYPWARPPEEVYLLFPLKTFTGISARYVLDLGPTTLSVEPFGGDSTRATNMFGFTTEWSWHKTMARVAYNRAMWDLNFTDKVKIGKRRIELWSYGLRSEWSKLSVMAEYATTKDLDEQKYQDLSKETLNEAVAAAQRGEQETANNLFTQALVYSFHFGGSKGYYITPGYQVTDMLALYFTYASLKKEPITGANEDQKSTAIGINIEPTNESVVKLEAKRISVPDEGRGLFKDPTMEERKGLNGTMIYSINYNLIF